MASVRLAFEAENICTSGWWRKISHLTKCSALVAKRYFARRCHSSQNKMLAVSYLPYWYFYNTFPVTYTLHVCELACISGGGEDGGGVTARRPLIEAAFQYLLVRIHLIFLRIHRYSLQQCWKNVYFLWDNSSLATKPGNLRQNNIFS